MANNLLDQPGALWIAQRDHPAVQQIRWCGDDLTRDRACAVKLKDIDLERREAGLYLLGDRAGLGAAWR
ncbi:MAG: hypothetical protein C4289_01060 [Chloroflexota bacterium]